MACHKQKFNSKSVQWPPHLTLFIIHFPSVVAYILFVCSLSGIELAEQQNTVEDVSCLPKMAISGKWFFSFVTSVECQENYLTYSSISWQSFFPIVFLFTDIDSEVKPVKLEHYISGKFETIWL